MKNIKKILPYAITLFAGIIIGWVFFRGGNDHPQPNPMETESGQAAKIWTCSMHPQIRLDKPGKCPICAMDLVPLNNEDDNDADINKIQMSESAMKIADIQTTIVQISSPGKEIRLSGKVKPDERKISIITSHYPGRIEKLFVNFTGQEVREGEKLATVFSPELITAQKELFEAIKFKQSNPEYYKAARNKLKLWLLTNSQIDNIETSGEPQYYFDVTSHLSGTVTKRSVLLGDHVMEGMMLFEIVDLSSVWVMLDAYESDLPWIRTGDLVNFEVQSLPGKMYSGKVTFIDPVVNAENRVAYIRTELANPGNLLKPEMFVRGVIKAILHGAATGLIVPKSSVLWTGKTAVVYVKDKSKAKPTFEYREIVLGEDAGNFYIVKNGLNEGEEIVTNGVFKVDAAAQLAGKRSMMNSEQESGTHAEHKSSKVPKNELISTPKSLEGDFNPPPSGDGGVDGSEKKNNLSFKVFGNCEMCKARIEKAAKSVNGIISADWNKDTKMIQLVIANSAILAKTISKTIADAGHDTDFHTASDEAYNKLPGCCQFERKEVHNH